MGVYGVGTNGKKYMWYITIGVLFRHSHQNWSGKIVRVLIKVSAI